MSNARAGRRVGEVIVSHTERIDAQCYNLHAAPPLGALLRIGTPPVYGVVLAIWNEPLDPTRPLAPRGADMELEDEIYAANPQLSAMLTTRLSASIVGYRDGLAVREGLPPRPPNLHAFVFTADSGEIAEFARDLGWMRTILADRSAAADSALVGILRWSAEASSDRREFLLRAGKTLARELANDPQRLHAVLRGMSA